MSGNNFSFDLLKVDGRARAGKITTARGEIRTPVFMPVGTQGTVKALKPEDVAALGADIILCNTYHMMLRPGAEIVGKFGGLHKFIGWDRPILTDSGGFQVYSLAGLRKLDKDGVTFRSHIDGSSRRLDPESSIEIQTALDADIMMAFDECPPYGASRDEVIRATDLSNDWAIRSKKAAADSPGALFGIIQGGVFDDLRSEAAAALVAEGFDGYALGGLSVGEPKELMLSSIEAAEPQLPVDAPRYLMGVGTPADLLDAIERGIDMFDCVMPTRNARNGMLFTSRGKFSVKLSANRDKVEPPDPECDCPVCRKYSLAYLRHLFSAGEILSSVLNTTHNVYFYLSLMRRARAAIEQGNFESFRRETLQKMDEGERENKKQTSGG